MSSGLVNGLLSFFFKISNQTVTIEKLLNNYLAPFRMTTYSLWHCAVWLRTPAFLQRNVSVDLGPTVL